MQINLANGLWPSALVRKIETEPIPNHFLGNVRVTGSVNLACTENNNLQVSENAFRASIESIRVIVTIRGCNLEKLNFLFTFNMKKLSLYI